MTGYMPEGERLALVASVLAGVVETAAAMDSGDPLRAVHALSLRRVAVEEGIAECVAVARMQGITWQKIADALGVSKAAAHERYSARGSGATSAPALLGPEDYRGDAPDDVREG